jgi:hypothetical protein
VTGHPPGYGFSILNFSFTGFESLPAALRTVIVAK